MPRFDLLKILTFYVLVGLCLGGPGVIMAQESNDIDAKELGKYYDKDLEQYYAEEWEQYGFAEPVKDEYILGTYLELTKLYWTLNKFDINDNQAIENFLIITECDLYKRYHDNEFEWTQIIEDTRKYIANNLPMWPTTYEIIIPLYLDRYDIENKIFKIQEENWFKDARRLNVNQNRTHREICDISAVDIVEEYPENIILALDRPFTFTEIPMLPELANLYIQASNRRYQDLPHNLKKRRYKRFAYLRLKVRVFAYQSTSRVTGEGSGARDKATVMGLLTGIEVYADKEKTKPLYSKETPKEKRPIRKRRVLEKDNHPK